MTILEAYGVWHARRRLGFMSFYVAWLPSGLSICGDMIFPTRRRHGGCAELSRKIKLTKTVTAGLLEYDH